MSTATLFIGGQEVAKMRDCSYQLGDGPETDEPPLGQFTFTFEGDFSISRRDLERLFPPLSFKRWLNGLTVTPKRFERRVKKVMKQRWNRYRGSQKWLADEGRRLLARDYYPLLSKEVANG